MDDDITQEEWDNFAQSQDWLDIKEAVRENAWS